MMGIFDRFKQRAERIPKELVKEVVERSKSVRRENNEYHEAIAYLLRSMDQRNSRSTRHVKDT